MTKTFAEVVEMIYHLPHHEKLHIAELLEKNISEERRNEINKNFLKAKREEKLKSLDFSEDIHKLRQLL
jgi:hypothetical protein